MSETLTNTEKALLFSLAVILFVAGLLAGLAVQQGNHPLVQCQEDEVWYPEDFTGSEAPEDLVCIHREEL